MTKKIATLAPGKNMKKDDTEVGTELLFLLRQQHCLYHQLKILTDRQQQLVGTDSPELLLEVISGRRKLLEKLHELDDKLRPVKANWPKLSSQIGSEQAVQVSKLANQVQEIIGQILAIAPSETVQNVALHENCRFDEIFAQPQY